MRRCLCGWFLLKTSYSPSDHLLNMDEDILEVGVRNDCLKLVTKIFWVEGFYSKAWSRKCPSSIPLPRSFTQVLGLLLVQFLPCKHFLVPLSFSKFGSCFQDLWGPNSHLVKASVEMSFLQPALPRTLHHLGNSQPQVCARAGLQAWVCQGKNFLRAMLKIFWAMFIFWIKLNPI